jgi:hypothetical protein
MLLSLGVCEIQHGGRRAGWGENKMRCSVNAWRELAYHVGWELQ